MMSIIIRKKTIKFGKDSIGIIIPKQYFNDGILKENQLYEIQLTELREEDAE